LQRILRRGSEWLPLKNRSVAARVGSGLVLTVVALMLTACGNVLYKDPNFNFAGRPIPPSGLLQRVMASYTANGSSGGLEILDGLRDLRSNVQNTIPVFTISGYSNGNPSTIINYPEESLGYVFSSADGSMTAINYGKEATAGTVASFAPTSPSVAASVDGARYVGAEEGSGQLAITAGGAQYFLNLPNIDKVVVNSGDTVILAMARNSNALYRVVKLNVTNTPTYPPGYIDCQPILLPVYCVVPVPGTYDHPSNVYFSLDGNTAYVMNCGPECGGTTAGITFLQEGALTVDVIPTVNPLGPGAPSVLANVPGANPLAVPGGVTDMISDGTTLYIAGQSLFNKGSNGALIPTPRADGLFTGYLTTMNLATNVLANPISISDGNHTKMLFADDNTLWLGSQQCANGERQATGQNYNCLTMISLGGTTLTAAIIPNVTPGGVTQVPFPNTNQNPYYYGSLTGLCWVQEFHKIFTAYGGQIHAFYTGGPIININDPANGTTPVAGTELDNSLITVQGTVLDVAYIDALDNNAN
jgi:hypothetical protein